MSTYIQVRTIHFCQTGDFAAVREAEAFLAAAGFSVGRTQAHAPRGILFGDYDIQKWRNLRPEDRMALHGEMVGGRAGPVTVALRVSAPEEALNAFRRARDLAPPATLLDRGK